MLPRQSKQAMHDASLIVIMRGLRSFAYGMMSILVVIALTRAGFSPAAIGLLITISLLGDLCGTYLIGLIADSFGRRRTLVVLALLMAGTGLVFGWLNTYALLLVAAFVGTLGTTASETAPFLPIEQAMLAQGSAPSLRTSLFARYNLVATFCGAAGALVAGLPDWLTRVGISPLLGIRLLFGGYVVVALLVVLLVLRLSANVEVPLVTRVARTSLLRRLLPPLGKARGKVLMLSGLFSIDAFAGGLVVQSLLALFFHLRFGVELSGLSMLIAAANLCSALSMLAAAPLARRFGLLNTMVFTHLPSNLLLVLVVFMPTVPLAVLLLLVRQTLSQLDVPTRQVYTMALVEPEARTASASVTSLARSAGSATSPVLGGLLLQSGVLLFGAPLILAGALKIAYDLTLWAVFRQVSLAGQKASQEKR
ncbi:MAG TPA: MFS transporter [Ktedonosporobacter sp.]|nr:MFS transporter [Ktedonosporobacter sp.]